MPFHTVHGVLKEEYRSGCSQVFMPLSMSLDVTGICSATAKKSTCRYGLKEGLQRYQLPSLRVSAPSTLGSLFLCPLLIHHHLNSFPPLTSSFLLAAKSAPSPNSPREALADKLAWGLVFRTSLSTEYPFDISVW